MATVIPVDEFVSDEWYPGFVPGPDHAPWAVDRFRTFAKSDEDTLWFLEAHTPRGLTPLAMVWAEDGLTCCPQQAAEALPLPPARGYGARLAGTHPYACMLPVTSPYELAERGARFAANFPEFLTNYQRIWDARVDEVERGWQHFRGRDLAGASPAEIAGHLRDARAFHKRAYDIHFDIIFPLTVNHFGFFGVCAQLGIDTSQVGKFLQGYDTKIMETDRGLGALTVRARELGLRELFTATEPERLRAALTGAGTTAATTWLAEFDAFLDVYGWRCEGPCDIALPSWMEDPTPALGMIRSFLLSDRDHDFAAANAAAVAERETAIDAARSQLTVEEQRQFDGALAGCQAANLPWWLDDHNYYIDLRVSLPMRWGALAAADALGCPARDDTLFLFWPELMDVLEGRRTITEFGSLITQRRDYFDHWAARRASMPKALGTVPDTAAEIQDPTVTEILGINDHFLHGVHAAAGAGGATGLQEVRGIGASRGTARGTARVLTNSTDLHRVEPGEILVCEATSPNWTPAFGKIAACVCDSGGMLSHAAVVGREYGIPTVVAVGIGTLVIRDGDEIEVDGATGAVTVLTRAATP